MRKELAERTEALERQIHERAQEIEKKLADLENNVETQTYGAMEQYKSTTSEYTQKIEQNTNSLKLPIFQKMQL